MSNFKATNDFRLTRFAFYERLRYKLRAYEGSYHTNLKEINFGELSFYGRVNYTLDSIYLNQSYLKNIDGENHVVNFVADAFNDITQHFQYAYSFESISINEKYLSNPECAEGYVDPLFLYNEYINEVFDVYNNSYITAHKAKTFDMYLSHLLPYMKILGSEFPMSFSAWMRNKNTTPFVSGLMINISSNTFDNDILKESDFLKSPNFDFYVNTCKSKGFYVSKRNPSLLIADISSKQMKQYMLRYGVSNARSLFNNYFTLAIEQDVNLLVAKIIEHYGNFIDKLNVIQSEVKISRDNKTYHKVFNLEKDYNININNNILYNLYTNIRNIEEDYVFGQADINQFIKTAINVEKKFDRLRAIDYINKQFTSTYPSKYGGLNYYRKKFQAMEDE